MLYKVYLITPEAKSVESSLDRKDAQYLLQTLEDIHPLKRFVILASSPNGGRVYYHVKEIFSTSEEIARDVPLSVVKEILIRHPDAIVYPPLDQASTSNGSNSSLIKSEEEISQDETI